MNTEVQIQKYINEFKKEFGFGIESIIKASEIYVKAIEDNPKNSDIFREEFSDSIPSSAWSSFEAIGRKWMHPKLLLGGGGKYAGNIKRLPYSLQERIFAGEKFDLLTTEGDKLKVDIRTISPEQAEQIFDRTNIRTISEQKAYLEGIKNKSEDKEISEVTAIMPYKIKGNKVYFKANTVMTKDELKRLAIEMI